jgi:hypothetical protein
MKTTSFWSKRFICLACVAMVVTVAAGKTSSAESRSDRAARPTPSESQESDAEVPFTVQDGYLIVVEVRIKGQRPARFALDTGATHSIVRPALAQGFAQVPRPVRIVNLDRVLTQNMVEVTDFQLGPIRIPQLPMMINDLAYLRETSPGLDGMIGLDVLRLRSFSIDFARRKITFGTPQTLRSSAAMEINESYLAVEVRMVNRPVLLLVDSGVPTILLYRDRMGERLPNVKIERQIRGASLSGGASLDVVTLPPVQLNKTELVQRAVLLRNSPVGFLQRVDGYLSLTSLRAGRISFDFERYLLSWE